MTEKPIAQTLYVGVPYSMTELSESEERHEIGEFIDSEGFDYRGYCGEVLIDGKWHIVWAFGSDREAKRFVKLWGGLVFD